MSNQYSRREIPDLAAFVARCCFQLTTAAMAGIDRATIDQGNNVILDAASLREAIFSGIAEHLINEIREKKKIAIRL